MYGLFYWNAKTHAFQEVLAPSMSLCTTSFNTTYTCSPNADIAFLFRFHNQQERVTSRRRRRRRREGT
jgi:hypothetical protein